MRHITFAGTVVRDERQLDGSRHLEVVGEIGDSEVALYVVVDHDGELAEADMTLELDGEPESVAFEGDSGLVDWDDMRFTLTSERFALDARPRQDGDLDMRLVVRGANL